MEQITKRDGVYYYGERRCVNVDEAYGKFRSDYHSLVGRDAFRRLDRLGQRTERVHGFGFDFDTPRVSMAHVLGGSKIRYRILGLVLVGYGRSIGLWDYTGVPDEQFEEWLDWLFSRGSGGLTLVGKHKGSGRADKRLKTRYR